MAVQHQSEVWRWQQFFDELSAFLHQLERQEGRANQRFAEYALERLEAVVVNVTAIKDVLTAANGTEQQRAIISEYESGMSELLQSLHLVVHEWDTYLDNLLSRPDSPVSYRSATTTTGRRGRPKFQISREQLEYLSSMSFTWIDIASLLGISRMTIYRRRVEYGMLLQGNEISDVMLNTLILEMRVDFPDMGEVMVLGRL